MSDRDWSAYAKSSYVYKEKDYLRITKTSLTTDFDFCPSLRPSRQTTRGRRRRARGGALWGAFVSGYLVTNSRLLSSGFTGGRSRV